VKRGGKRNITPLARYFLFYKEKLKGLLKKMKRKNHLFEHIIDPDNLRLAFYKAQLGKTAKLEVREFRENLEDNLYQLRESLLSGSCQMGGYKKFTVYEPKERIICAAPFGDRVVHHAIMNICEQDFERYQIFDNYACRKGKGQYKALERAFAFNKKYRWFLKLDVRKYFDSINHDILKEKLRRMYKDISLISLFDRIIDSYCVSGLDARHAVSSNYPSVRCGLPIGNLTSQYFANFYLGAIDHYIKEHLCVSGYVRYMDDMVLWGDSKAELLLWYKQTVDFSAGHLSLQLKEICLNRVEKGLPFLGYQLFGGKILLRPQSKQRYKKKINIALAKYRDGEWNRAQTLLHTVPLTAFVRKCSSMGVSRMRSPNKKQV
jgi:retron-type reverse transcriptase